MFSPATVSGLVQEEERPFVIQARRYGQQSVSADVDYVNTKMGVFERNSWHNKKMFLLPSVAAAKTLQTTRIDSTHTHTHLSLIHI